MLVCIVFVFVIKVCLMLSMVFVVYIGLLFIFLLRFIIILLVSRLCIVFLMLSLFIWLNCVLIFMVVYIFCRWNIVLDLISLFNRYCKGRGLGKSFMFDWCNFLMLFVKKFCLFIFIC